MQTPTKSLSTVGCTVVGQHFSSVPHVSCRGHVQSVSKSINVNRGVILMLMLFLLINSSKAVFSNNSNPHATYRHPGGFQ